MGRSGRASAPWVRLQLTLFLALLSVVFAAKDSGLASSLASNECRSDNECGASAFCTPPESAVRYGPYGAIAPADEPPGQCLPCWMCCSLQGSLLGESSGCAERRCVCGLGDSCSSSTCSPGLECRDGSCQSCLACDTSPSGCTSSCRSFLELLDYVELPADNVRQLALLPDSPDTLFVQQWISRYSGVSLPLDSLIHVGTEGGVVELSPWVVLARGSSFSTSCYQGMGKELRSVVAPGCPCNPRAGQSQGAGMCPAGYQCARGAYSSDPTLHTCLPCPVGTYCPSGTSEITNVAEFLCSEGRYCPDPSLQLSCPVGAFCPLGSTYFRSCQYLTLFGEELSSVNVYKRSNVLEELIMQRKSWGGNVCPARSIDPFRRCPRGAFCETPAEVEICPAGSKCPSSSTDPIPCDSLVVSCPEGTEWGSVSIMGVVIVVIICVGLLFMMGVVTLAYKGMQKRQSSSMNKTDSYMKVKRIILESRLSLNATHLFKLLKSPMHTSEQLLRAKGPVQLEFENLGLKLSKGAVVLAGVSGKFEPRKLIAIMGPSGAGKSTFLNVLCGKASSYGKMTGVLKVNGREVKSVNQVPGKRNMGFVPQDDIVHEDLTVRENIWFSAMARLPSSLKLQQKRKIVDEVLFSLKLDHIEHSIVGSVEKRGISGGQRKRVNIGLELSALPTLLFLDEPTSGLDSTASTDVLDTLKHCAQLGMTVMTVIHQPRYSIFTACDDVLFLGKGGMTVYLGPTSFAANYFEGLGFRLPPNDNPADFCIDVISGGLRREGDMNFRPADLFAIWSDSGSAAVASYMADYAHAGVAEDDTPRSPYTPAAVNRPTVVMPRDIECMTNIFHDIDVDGDGSVSASQVMEYFKTLDLEMVEEEVRTFCAGRGQMSKQEFLSLMRNGPVEPTPAKRNRKLQRMMTKAMKPIRNLSRARSSKGSTRSGNANSGNVFKRWASFGTSRGSSAGSSDIRASHATSDSFTPTQQQHCTPTVRIEQPGNERDGEESTPTTVEGKRSAFFFSEGVSEAEVVAESAGRAVSSSAPRSRLARSTLSNGQVLQANTTPVQVQLFAEDGMTPSTEAASSPAFSGSRDSDLSDEGEGFEDTHIPAPIFEAEVMEEIAEEGQVKITVSADDNTPRASRCLFSTPTVAMPAGNTTPDARDIVDGYSSDEASGEDGKLESCHQQHSTGRPGDVADSPSNICVKLAIDLMRFASHYVLLTYRRGLQWLRAWPSKILIALLLAGSGALLGVILRFHNGLDVVPLRGMLALLTLGLLCGIPSLQVFSNARAMWWRERSSGISPFAYALSGVTLDTFDVAIRPLLFMSMFYYFILPSYSFFNGYRVVFAASWYVSGLAYVMSSVLPPSAASISLVCLTMVLGGLFNGVLPTLSSMTGEPMYYLVMISYVRWGIEALTILEFSGFPAYRQPPAAVTLAGIGYCGLDVPLSNLIEQAESGLTVVLDEQEIAEQVELLKTAAASAVGEESFITMQCMEYVDRDILAMVVAGLIFRAVAFLALRWTGKRS